MTVPEAIRVAKEQLAQVLPEFGRADVQLEELETAPYASTWRFTFSVTLPPAGESAMSLQEMIRGRRLVKSVEVDAVTGNLIAVKNKAA